MFQCEQCKHEAMVGCDRGHIEEPSQCANCGAKWAMKLLHNRCGFMNKQIIKMQARSQLLVWALTIVEAPSHDRLLGGISREKSVL